MPNLVVTNQCNLRCSFCFASEYRADDAACAPQRMTLDEFRTLLDFVGTDTIRFCGGEPTLHPQFPAMLSEALGPAKRRVLLMTNGLWPDGVVQQVSGLSRSQRRRITYLVNTLEPSQYAEGQQTLLHKALGVMDSSRVTLGVTLHNDTISTRHLFELADRHRISHLRYSVAAPNLTDPRSWLLEPARDFPNLAQRVLSLSREARERGLRLHSDCGYIPPCMFTSEQLRELRGHPDGGAALSFGCSGPVDIGPGGTAWRCYGLYSVLRANTAEFAGGAELAAHFDAQTEALESQLLFDACGDCQHRARGECGGGCYAFRARRGMTERAEQQGVALDDDRALLDTAPALDASVLRRWRHSGRDVWMLREPDGTWSPVEFSAFEDRLLGAFDGSQSVRQIIEGLESARGAEQTYPEAMRSLRTRYQQGAIVLRPRSKV